MNRTRQTEAGRLRHSITSKLHRKMFFRLFRLFISLNIILCVISAIGLFIYSERSTMRAVSLFADSNILETGKTMDIAGTVVRQVDVSDFPVARISAETWPFSYAGNKRSSQELALSKEILYRGFRAAGTDFRNMVLSLEYVVGVRVDSDAKNTIYEFSLSIGAFAYYFACCLCVLLAFEILKLLTRTLSDRRMVRKTLDPIAELARTAQSLHEVNRHLDHEKTMALAGKLDGIDAGRLDTRIQVDDLQEELKNVAVAINGMLDRINESYAAQARFVSDASHELRTPIAVIQGYANLLDRWGKEDEKALTESVSAIKDEAENMKGLVEQLLFLARGDSNRIHLSKERLELAGLIDEVASEARMLDEERIIISNSDDVIVFADKTLVKQTLRILVDNAIKYTDPGGEITISAKKHADAALISVTDTGIGIRSDILPHVFDRFVRADESRTRATGGAGLGLSIAQWIASRHDGRLEVLSREGIGTRVTFIMPILS